MRDAGAKNVAIILGSIYPEKVQEVYGNGSVLGMQLEYIRQDEPRGLAHAVSLAKEFVGNDSFVVCLGDNLIKGGISSHARNFVNEKPEAMVLLSKVSDPGRFGVAKFDTTGRLEALIEKPKQPPSSYALVGTYFLTPTIFDFISQLKPSERGELEITEAIQLLLKAKRNVKHSFVEGWWKDTGTVQDILDSNTLILDDKMQHAMRGTIGPRAKLEGRVHVSEGTEIKEGSLVRGPAYIGPNSVIGPNAYVGPYTSIGANCQLSNSEIESSVVLDDVTITNVSARITSSIIGAHSEVLSTTERPSGYRLILGEQSSVKV